MKMTRELKDLRDNGATKLSDDLNDDWFMRKSPDQVIKVGYRVGFNECYKLMNQNKKNWFSRVFQRESERKDG